MKIGVNLATRPFIELRPFFARLRLIMAALVVVGVVLVATSYFQQTKLDRQQAQMDVLRNQTIAAQKGKLADERRMREPANQGVLNRAHFLNALFLRKSFSWTGVMMDLEHVLPTGVQVTAIEPRVTTDGEVSIQLRVSGPRERAVQLVRNLEHSSRFLHPRLTAETLQTKEQANASAAAGAPGGVEFNIVADYNPLPGPAAAVVASPDAQAGDVIATPRHARQRTRPVAGAGVVLKPYDAAHPVTPRYAVRPPTAGGVK